MNQYIKKCDCLIQPFEFNINNRERAVSTLGGLITIFIGIFTMFYFIGAYVKATNNLNQIFAGSQSDEVLEITSFLSKPLVAIQLSSEDGTIFQNLTEISQYVEISTQLVQQQRQEDVQGYQRNYTEINLTKCDEQQIESFSFDPLAITNNQVLNLLCINGDFNLQGQFFDSYFSYFRIALTICNNKSNCKSIKEIEDFINSGIKIDLFIQGARIKSKFVESTPAQTFSQNIYWKLQTQMADIEDIFIEPIALDLKKKRLLYDLFGQYSTERIYNGSSIKKQERRQEPLKLEQDAILASFNFRESQDSQYYFMLYQDAASLFFQSMSESSGLFIALIGIARIFYKFYSEHETFQILMNHVYMFDFQNEKKNPKQDENNMIIESNKEAIYEKELEETLNSQICFTFWEYIKYKTGKCFRKLKGQQKEKKFAQKTREEKERIISSIAKQKIERDLDLSNIMRKLYEIDFLKLILFDDNQLMLFNTICKPLFSDKFTSQMVDKEDFMQTIQETLKKVASDKELEEEKRNKDLEKAELSDLPLDIRLARLSWFFKSELKFDNKLLSHYQKMIKNNKDYQFNEKLLKFLQQHKKLNDTLEKIGNTKSFQFYETKHFPVVQQQQQVRRPSRFSDMRIPMRNQQTIDADLTPVLNSYQQQQSALLPNGEQEI